MEVHEQLAKMHANFEGLRGQFQVMGRAAGKASARMGTMLDGMNSATRQALCRLEGQLAAKEDWGKYLWPDDGERTDD